MFLYKLNILHLELLLIFKYKEGFCPSLGTRQIVTTLHIAGRLTVCCKTSYMTLPQVVYINLKVPD